LEWCESKTLLAGWRLLEQNRVNERKGLDLPLSWKIARFSFQGAIQRRLQKDEDDLCILARPKLRPRLVPKKFATVTVTSIRTHA